MNRNLVLAILGVIAVAALGYLFAQTGGPSAPHAATQSDGSGWLTSIDAALRDASSGPRVIVVTRAGWSSYERAVYQDPSMKALLELVPRARIDMFSDSQRLMNWGLEGAPALVLVNAKGELLTSLVGARDVSFLKRAIERTREFPYTRAELAARTDTPSLLRLAEVHIDQGDFESAAIVAGPLAADSGATGAAATYLLAYAAAELQKTDEARAAADRYLRAWPEGADATGALWIQAVLELQKDRGREAEGRVIAILDRDSSSYFSRQAVLAYSLKYLAQEKRQLPKAEQFLSSCMERATPWSDDFRMARASLRLSSPATLADALEDYKTVVANQGRAAEEAEERLIMISAQPGGEGAAAPLILWFQDLVRRPGIADRTRFALARLYVVGRSFDRGKEEARALAGGTGDFADDALLLLGALKLEEELDPAGAVTLFQDLVGRFPARETFWAAKYGLARAQFFAGRVEESKATMGEVIGWLTGRRFLPDAFALIAGPQAPAAAVQAQMKGYHEKATEILEKGEQAVFQKLVGGVLSASKGDSGIARAAFEQIVTEHPASSLADDALMELAKISLRNQDVEGAKTHLERVVASYRGQDQFEEAEQMLQIINQNRR